MYPLISRSLGLVSFISIAVVSMWVLEKSFVFADSALVSEAKQNDPEANLRDYQNFAKPVTPLGARSLKTGFHEDI